MVQESFLFQIYALAGRVTAHVRQINSSSPFHLVLHGEFLHIFMRIWRLESIAKN